MIKKVVARDDEMLVSRPGVSKLNAELQIWKAETGPSLATAEQVIWLLKPLLLSRNKSNALGN